MEKFIFVLLCVLCSDCVAQRVYRITAPDGGTGTGFAVASRGGRTEIWSNAHVTGGVGTVCQFEQFLNGQFKRIGSGVVRAYGYGGRSDWAKCLCDFASDDIFSIELSHRQTPDRTFGHPNGGRWYGVGISQNAKGITGVIGYDPASIPGQSGSPVVNQRGAVIGVVTLKLGSGRTAIGGYLPIQQWAEETRAVSSRLDFGPFELLSSPQQFSRR